MIVRVMYYPTNERMIESFHDLYDLVMKLAPPGNTRRSVLGMVDTPGEFCAVTYIENTIRSLNKFVIISVYKSKGKVKTITEFVELK